VAAAAGGGWLLRRATGPVVLVAGSVMVVGSAPVVVGSSVVVVGSTVVVGAVVDARAAVVVGCAVVIVVGCPVVGGAVAVGRVVLAPTVGRGWLVAVVTAAVAGARTVSGPLSGVAVEWAGTLDGRGEAAVVGEAGVGAGWVGRAPPGACCGGVG
jgi:hypothetical protein